MIYRGLRGTLLSMEKREKKERKKGKGKKEGSGL